MVSKKIQDLTNDDLDYLEKLLSDEFKRQMDYKSVFKAKNSYHPPNNEYPRIARLRQALQSQKQLNNIEKW